MGIFGAENSIGNHLGTPVMLQVKDRHVPLGVITRFDNIDKTANPAGGSKFQIPHLVIGPTATVADHAAAAAGIPVKAQVPSSCFRSVDVKVDIVDDQGKQVGSIPRARALIVEAEIRTVGGKSEVVADEIWITEAEFTRGTGRLLWNQLESGGLAQQAAGPQMLDPNQDGVQVLLKWDGKVTHLGIAQRFALAENRLITRFVVAPTLEAARAGADRRGIPQARFLGSSRSSKDVLVESFDGIGFSQVSEKAFVAVADIDDNNVVSQVWISNEPFESGTAKHVWDSGFPPE